MRLFVVGGITWDREGVRLTGFQIGSDCWRIACLGPISDRVRGHRAHLFAAIPMLG